MNIENQPSTPYGHAIARLIGTARNEVVRALAGLIGKTAGKKTAKAEVGMLWDIVEALHITSKELCEAGLDYHTAETFAMRTLFRNDRKRWLEDELF